MSLELDEWRQYARDAEAEIMSLTRERDRMRAALIRLRDCDWTITLPDRMDAVRAIARAALEEARGRGGRPAEMAGGRRVNVYLDSASLTRAAELGDGNVSEGIRRALTPESQPPAPPR